MGNNCDKKFTLTLFVKVILSFGALKTASSCLVPLDHGARLFKKGIKFKSSYQPIISEDRKLNQVINFNIGVNNTAQVFSVDDTMTDVSYFDISEIKLSITSLYIIPDAFKYYIIWTENSDVIDSFISEILKYKSWILASWRKRSWTVRFTPI